MRWRRLSVLQTITESRRVIATICTLANLGRWRADTEQRRRCASDTCAGARACQDDRHAPSRGRTGGPLQVVMRDPLVRRWLPRCARVAKRFGSVCGGTFVLAALGLLDGRRALDTSPRRPTAMGVTQFSAMLLRRQSLNRRTQRVCHKADRLTAIQRDRFHPPTAPSS
jgi:hypothetical protein